MSEVVGAMEHANHGLSGQSAFAGYIVPASIPLPERGGMHRIDAETETLIAVPLQEVGKRTGTSTDDPRAGIGIGNADDPMYTLQSGAQHGIAVAFTERTRADGRNFESQEELAYALTNPGSGGRTHSREIAAGMAVRRLTPTECERLQGFSDGFTAIEYRGKPAADGPRYRALGNSMAVPVMRWILTRLRGSA